LCTLKGSHPEIKILTGKTKHPELHGIILEAKRCLEAGDLNKAIRLAVQLDLLWDKIEDEEKTEIGYDIQELKTNIKLASLAQ